MLHNIRLVNTYIAKDSSQKDVWVQTHDDIMDANANGQECLFCVSDRGGKAPARFFGGYVVCDLHMDKHESIDTLLIATVSRRISDGPTEGIQKQG